MRIGWNWGQTWKVKGHPWSSVLNPFLKNQNTAFCSENLKIRTLMIKFWILNLRRSRNLCQPGAGQPSRSEVSRDEPNRKPWSFHSIIILRPKPKRNFAVCKKEETGFSCSSELLMICAHSITGQAGKPHWHRFNVLYWRASQKIRNYLAIFPTWGGGGFFSIPQLVHTNKTSQELRMLSPSLCIQRSQCNCSYCCSQLSEM